MYLCYIDESGTHQIPGNTSHYVLSGIAIPIDKWKSCDAEINRIKSYSKLQNAEIHTAWILRKYGEQDKINNFEEYDSARRISEVEQFRKNELLRLLKSGNPNLYRQTKKNFIKTQPYIHLSIKERIRFIEEVAAAIGNWGFVRLFAECVDKVFFDPSKSTQPIDEQAFEQLLSFA